MPGQVSVTHSFILTLYLPMYFMYTKSYKAGKQPHCQALSPVPPLSPGERPWLRLIT